MDQVSLAGSYHLVPMVCDDLSIRGLIRRLRVRDPYIRAYTLAKIFFDHGVPKEPLLGIAANLAAQSPFLYRVMCNELIQESQFDYVDEMKAPVVRGDNTVSLAEQYVEASLKNQPQLQVNLLFELFLNDGQIAHLVSAAELSENSLGWHSTVKIILQLLFIEPPPHATRVTQLLRVLMRNERRREFEEIGYELIKLEKCDIPRAFYYTQKRFWNGDFKLVTEALDATDLIGSKTGAEDLFSSLYAQSLEKIGAHERAAAAFSKQNQLCKSPKYTFGNFKAQIAERQEIPLGVLPVIRSEGHFIMTGFPRSGTTMLENALDAHPAVSTAEESGAFTKTFAASFDDLLSNGGSVTSEAYYLRAVRHRRAYFRALGRHLDKTKPVKIDKSPIISAHAHYLEKLLPEWRYIFSIRHPYDVVLSAFKQCFEQNMAMAAFNQMDTACELYDYVMSSWFEVFPGETDRVCYVYYDELVTRFEPTVRCVIDFLGVEWDEAVLDFAEHSKKRAVRTPSYANVRKGLSLGVQSSYQDYLFLFDDYCRSKLNPWVEFFGYTVEEPET